MSVQSRNAVPTPTRGFPSVSPRVRRGVRPGAVGVHALMPPEFAAARVTIPAGRHREGLIGKRLRADADAILRANGGQQ